MQEVRPRVLHVGDFDDEGVNGHVSRVERRVGPGILNGKQTLICHIRLYVLYTCRMMKVPTTWTKN